MVLASAIIGNIHIQPRKDRKIVKKADLVDSKTQQLLKVRNKGLLSLDGGGLRGLLTGEQIYFVCHCLLGHLGLLPLHWTN